MLERLSIKNLLNIQQAHLDFELGLVVFTGGSGVGKSVLLRAVSLLCAQISNPGNLLLSGVDNASITGQFKFTLSAVQVRQICEQYADFRLVSVVPVVPVAPSKADDLSAEQLSFELSCELSAGGSKCRYRLNTKTISALQLRIFCSNFMRYLGQHAQLDLQKEKNQRQYLDDFANHHQLQAKVATAYHSWRKLAQLRLRLGEQISGDRRRDDFQAVFDRYHALEHSPEKWSEANRLLDAQLNRQDLLDALAQVEHLLSGADAHSVGQSLQSVNKILHQQMFSGAGFSALADKASELDELCNDLTREISRCTEKFDVDEEQLLMYQQYVEQICALAHDLHLARPEDLYEHMQLWQEELSELADKEQQLAQVLLQIKEVQSDYQRLAQELSSSRQAAAMQINQQIKPLLRQLGLGKCHCEISVLPMAAEIAGEINSSSKISEFGIDSIMLQWQSLQKAKLVDLEKVASGGELSRLQLALYALLAKRSQVIGLILLDEADTGIGGDLAHQFGDVLCQIVSSGLQVLAVSHFAQVAVRANQHWLLSDQDGLNITCLTKDARLAELERLLGLQSVAKQGQDELLQVKPQTATLLWNSVWRTQVGSKSDQRSSGRKRD